jgi:hypothetical protein
MRRTVCCATLAALCAVLVLPLHAQNRQGLMGDLIKDVTEVEGKIVGLAKAMPEATYQWRPMKGVRSTSETLLHVAADNYFLPAAMGTAAPAETGINGKDYKSAAAFEQKKFTRDQIIAEVETTHLHEHLGQLIAYARSNNVTPPWSK